MTLETSLLEAFAEAHPAELARALESMPSSGAAEVIAELREEASAELLRWLPPVTAAGALADISVEQAAHVLTVARRDVAAAVLRGTSASRRASVMEYLSPKAKKALKNLLRYTEDTAGALMDPDVLAVAESVSVAGALERIERASRQALYYVYVVTEDQKLAGVVNLRELMGARRDQVVGLLATRPVEAVSIRASWRAVAAHSAWRRFHALPVVDENQRFAGVIRYESIRGLEERLIGSQLEDRGAQTGAALGELYGLGLRGLLESATAVLLGTSETGRSDR